MRTNLKLLVTIIGCLTLNGLTLVTTALSLSSLSTSAMAALPLVVEGEPLPSLAPMLEKIQSAVVNISTTTRTTLNNPLLEDPFYRRFFGFPEQPREREGQSLGSGVIVNAAKGHVITNHHVIDNADEITVTLKDGRSLKATVIGSDPNTDVAIIEVKPDQALVEIPIGDSDVLRVGDFVVAIGSPFGLSQTVTSGIVSALGRTGLNIVNAEGYENFIQTDASINPGNSGGALVNLRGELIGINTAIYSRSGGNVGIGFAIPVNMVSHLMSQIIEFGEVRRGKLGVFIQNLTPELAQALEISETKGAVITQVQPDSAAQRAGLENGDVITHVDDKRIMDSAGLRNAIGLLRAGSDISLRILRDGKEKMVAARVDAPSASIASTGQPQSRGTSGAEYGERLAGAMFETLFPPEGPGVVVKGVVEDSPAFISGLREGDVITSVNRRPVESTKDMQKALTLSTDVLLLNIQRGEGAMFLVIR